MNSDSLTPILHAISLSEIDITILLIILSVVMQNLYLFVVLCSLFTKHIPEQIFKRISHHYGWKIGERPPGAKNCNSINSGGDAHGSGLVSGHVFNLSSLTFFLLYTFTANKRTITTNEITLLSIMFIFIGVLMYARVKLNCHTKEQVVIGLILGCVWGYAMYLTVDKITESSDRVKHDKMRLNTFLNDV